MDTEGDQRDWREDGKGGEVEGRGERREGADPLDFTTSLCPCLSPGYCV